MESADVVRSGENAEEDNVPASTESDVDSAALEDEVSSSTADETLEQNGNASSEKNNGSSSRPAAEGITSVDQDQKATARCLMSNTAAGSIIGKAGANINELQRKSGAKLQLSRPTEFFPGTRDRVLSATGTTKQLSAAFTLILQTCQEDATQRNRIKGDDDGVTELKFLAPSAVCGVLIGKAGINIKGYSKESNANIVVSNLNEQLPGVSERIVTVTGLISEIVIAMALMLQKLGESRHYSKLANVPINYQGWGVQWPGGQLPMNGMPAAVPAILAPGQPAGSPTSEAELSLQVPDASIGAIIGKGGDIITQIKTLFDVGIRISDRENFVPGTRDREITIRGAPPRVHMAHQLIQDKISAAEANPPPTSGRRRQQ